MYTPPVDYASKLQYFTQLTQRTTNTIPGETIQQIANTDTWIGRSILDGGIVYDTDNTPMSIEAGPGDPIRDPNAKIRIYFNALSGRDDDLTQKRAQNGAIADYFFELRTDDIVQQAKAIANGEGYDPYHPVAQSFVKGLCQWFSEDDSQSVADTFEAVCHEYAGILKTGYTPTLSDLKTNFSFCGEEISISELFDMVEAGKKIAEQSNKYGNIGTSMYVGLAATGMLKAQALNYAKTLSSGVGRAFADNMTRLFDNNAKCSIQKWNNLSGTDVGAMLPEDYRSYVAEQASYAYQLFSQSNMSDSDVSARINQFCLKNQYAYGGIVTMDFRGIINGYYQQLSKLLA
ncbi:hypothetical protein D7V91_11480 [bacterium 1xD42-67]|nr:hypothetical protein D7V91_11480 [bacterium 1xD42-67]